MANLGQAIAGLGLAAGNTLLYGQEYDLKEAQLQERQQKIAMQKMSMASKMQEQKSEKELGSFIQSQIAEDNTRISNPLKTAQMYEKAAGMAAGAGNFSAAQTMTQLAKGATAEAASARKQQAEQQFAVQEQVAKAAIDFQQNPTPEGMEAVKAAAIRANVNPASIPKSLPEFMAWSKGLQTSAMSSEGRLKFEDKVRQEKATTEFNKQKFEQQEKDKAIQRQQLAESREQSRIMRQQAADERAARGQHSPQQERDAKAIVSSASEAVRGLRMIATMPPSASAGAFAGLKDGTVIEALGRVGGNVVTPQSKQMYQVAAAGLGLELGRLLTLGGGRGVNQSQINEFRHMVEVAPGDTEFTAMFKYANAADIIRNRLESQEEPYNEASKKVMKETKEWLDKVPTPEQILEVAYKQGKGAEVLKQFTSISDTFASFNSGNIDTKPGAPADYPADIKAILESQKGKK